MMTAPFSVRSIPARWSERIFRHCQARWTAAALAAFVFLPAAGAASLDRLVRDYRSKPTSARRTALVQFANRHAAQQSGALALLALGVAEYEHKSFDAAAGRLKNAGAKLPALRDYAAAWGAAAHLAAGREAEALALANEALKMQPLSPATARAALTAASALVKLNRAQEAATLLQVHLGQLPQPEGYALLAEALEAAGQPERAVAWRQKVYYEYPVSREAAEAGQALARLARSLGDRFPPAPAQMLLLRAEKLFAGRDYARAKKEFLITAEHASGHERDIAVVRAGAADYRAGQTQAALKHLQALEVQSPEAAAERLYWIVACARRLEDGATLRWALDRLAAAHPSSPWRAEALLTAANGEFLKERPEAYLPLYQACADVAPGQPTGAACHWKVVWYAYQGRKPEAEGLLRQHVATFPASEHANAALYYLGRIEQERGAVAAAKGYFNEVASRYPNSYYAMLARQRMAKLAGPAAAPIWLSSVAFPERVRRLDFTGDAASRLRSQRSRLLSEAGLDDLAEAELRFGIERGEPAPPLALELARAATRKGAPDQGVRHIKALLPGYLWLEPGGAPPDFWRHAFPFPFRPALEKWTSANGIDPFLFAGLIRQESEFNPKAVSPAGARGLSQVMPRTGRSLARQIGLRGFTTAMLFQPEVNLRLGAFYFKDLLRQHGGVVEHALASYNAGKSRTDAWSARGPFRDPEEFVESIPFAETRNYVQAVLRNADTYRRLYGGEAPPVRAAANLPAKKKVR